MRHLLVASSLLMGSVHSAGAQAGVGIDGPPVDIAVSVPAYPELVLVPSYPVYYDPRADSNYFFYEGVFWVYEGDDWYASSWYDGPWQKVARESVPFLLLRVPVRYYRRPPPHFQGWTADEPPRWGEHWGPGWERHRAGWDRWEPRTSLSPAPLPVYQQQYSGDRYPRAAEQQYSIRCEYYRYEPRETVARVYLRQREYMSWYPSTLRVNPKLKAHSKGPKVRKHKTRRRGGDRENRNEKSRHRR